MQLSDDMMTATMTIQPAYVGRRITLEKVEQALARDGVVCGILYDEITAALEAGQANKVVIASGTAPIPGEDSQFISLIPEVATQAPQLSENNTADYRNLGDIVSVSLGDPLLRRARPTAGVPGMNLLGGGAPHHRRRRPLLRRQQRGGARGTSSAGSAAPSPWCTRSIAYAKENPGSMEPGLFNLKQRIYAKYQGEIAELAGEKKRLQKRMEINAQARVEVERDAFLGAHIRIGSSALLIEEDLSNPTFTLGEEGIAY